MQRWYPLGLATRQLSLPITLTCGQSFRWTQLANGCWGGVVKGSLVLLRSQDDSVEFSAVNCGPSVVEGAAEQYTRALLLDYFNAQAPLERMYQDWSRCARKLRCNERAQLISLCQCGCALQAALLCVLGSAGAASGPTRVPFLLPLQQQQQYHGASSPLMLHYS
jgi:hypothetical protein